MFGCAGGRWWAILPLAVALYLPMTWPAAGQESGWASSSDRSPLEELLLARQPGDAPVVAPAPAPDAAEPPVAPPAAAPRPTPPPSPPADTDSLLAPRGELIRLAGMPNMFGDTFGLGYQLLLIEDSEFPPQNGHFDPESTTAVDVPPPGGGRRLKIGENNKALPTDRVFFMYNHFANALAAASPSFPTRTFSVDRYILGAEKTFCDGLWSTELRIPFGGIYSLNEPGFGVESAEVGNLGIIVKRVLWSSPGCVVAGGIGIDTPTGGDVIGQTSRSSFTFYNDALHLSPWMGFLRAPSDRFFYQGFLQVDVATNGNRVDFGSTRLGTISDQTLLLADLEMGYWLYRNPSARCLNGLASVVELHYTTTMTDADSIGGTDGSDFLTLTNTANRVDLLNLTVGLNADFGLTSLMVGGVFPLSTSSNRIFDAEVQVYLNRRF